MQGTPGHPDRVGKRVDADPALLRENADVLGQPSSQLGRVHWGTLPGQIRTPHKLNILSRSHFWLYHLDMQASLDFSRLLAMLISLLATSCATFYPKKDDGFRQRLAQGCDSESRCASLVLRANDRVVDCKPSGIGGVKCEDAKADLKQARQLEQNRRAATQHAFDEEQLVSVKAYEERKENERRAYEEARAERERREEEQRQSQEKAKAERVTRLAELRSLAQQREYAVPVLSAMICGRREALKQSQRDFAEEQRIDRLSGTVRPADRRDFVELIEGYKADIQRHEQRLRKHHVTARPCGKESAAIFQCVELEAQRGTYLDTGGLGVRDFDRNPLDARCDEPLGTYAEMIHERVMDE